MKTTDRCAFCTCPLPEHGPRRWSCDHGYLCSECRPRPRPAPLSVWQRLRGWWFRLDRQADRCSDCGTPGTAAFLWPSSSSDPGQLCPPCLERLAWSEHDAWYQQHIRLNP